MRFIKLYFIVFIFFLVSFQKSNASHLYGADLNYVWISGNTYNITLSLYGDCSGSAFPNLVSAVPEINIMNGNSVYSTINLSLQGTGTEVTPLCPSQLLFSACNGGSLPGVKQYVFKGNVTLPYISSNWRFRYEGSNGAGNQSGRSTGSITNIQFSSGGSLLTLEADLNNTNGLHNTSPIFTTLPTPFYCVNVAQQYNQGASDANNDSLVYTLTDALLPNGTVTYMPGYSGTNPISLAAGTNLNFDPMNGQLGFTGGTLQKSVVVNKIDEYRNGIKVGSCMREMTFVFLNCNNAPPAANIDSNLTACVLDANNYVNICVGNNNVAFSIHPLSPTGDTLKATLNGLPPGSSISITNNNTPNPIINFSWNTAGVPVGQYTFYATYKDNSCPLATLETIAYTLRIVNPFQLTANQISATNCLHQAAIKYGVQYGLAPYQITVKQNGNVIKTFNSSTPNFTDSLYAGTYNLTISSPKLLCTTDATITVVDSGKYPLLPSIVTPVYYCQFANPDTLKAIPTTGGHINWYTMNNNLIPTPTPSTTTIGVQQWVFSQTVNVCESDKIGVKVFVSEKPVSNFNLPALICMKDTALIYFTGIADTNTAVFNWTWDNPDTVNGIHQGPYKVHWKSPGVKTITLQVAQTGCKSDSIVKTLIVNPMPVADFHVENICLEDTANIYYSGLSITGQQYQWTFDQANIWNSNAQGPFNLHWFTPGIKTISLIVNTNTCADTQYKTLTIFPQPVAHITTTPKQICIGDKIIFEATGGTSYIWSPVDHASYQANGSIISQIFEPTTFKVEAISLEGCKGFDSVRFDNVVPCCHFSFPNSFTPNGDQKNDVYKIIMYGGAMKFDLQIFNRWGQKVFQSFDKDYGWDGYFGGKSCDIGTYYYRLVATCFTGHEEVYNGEIELIR